MVKNFKNRKLSWLIILVLAVSTFLLGRASVPVKEEPVSPVKVEKTVSISEEEIVKEINLLRTTNKLTALKVHPLLEKSAQLKADDIARFQYFAHISPDGKTPWSFFEEAGYNYTRAGENLAIHFLTAKRVVDGWLKSKAHKDIMLDPYYKEIGIGQSLWDSDIVIVAHFANK